VNILERLHTRKQRRLQTKTKTLRDLYEENMHQALEGALNDVMEQVEGRLGDLEEALDDASQVEGNTPPGGDVELREGMSEELIDHDQRRRLRIIMNMAIVRSFVAGLICGMIGETSQTLSKPAPPQPGLLTEVLGFHPLAYPCTRSRLTLLAGPRSVLRRAGGRLLLG
jgi:hypothetical protein